MNRKKSGNKRRNCVKPEEIWDAIDAFRDATKKNAINHYSSNGLSKCDFISVVIGNFISDIVENFSPRPELYQSWLNDEPVSMNMILDSIGNVGIVIGAAAFRLADQLEIELPDNEHENTLESTIPVIDREIMDEMASNQIKVSGCYFDYILQDSKSILCHNVYLSQRLMQKYEDANNQIGCEIVNELVVMDISCPSFSIGILCCMKLLVKNQSIIEILEDMLQHAQSRKMKLEQQLKDETHENHDGGVWLDVLSCIQGCEKILGILANKAA